MAVVPAAAEAPISGLSKEFVEWAAGETLLVTVERRRDGTRRKLLVRVPETGPCRRRREGAAEWYCALSFGGEEERGKGPCESCPDVATAE